MSDPTFNSVLVRRNTGSTSENLLTIDSIDGSDGNGSTLSFINNSANEGLHLALGRISAWRVDAGTVQLDLGLAADPMASSSDSTPTLLSLVKGAGAPAIVTAPGSTLTVSGTLSVSGAASVSGDLSWGNGARLRIDQAGSIELGNSLQLGVTPYIDFHYGVGAAQDYNVRLINHGDHELKLQDGSLRVTRHLSVEGAIVPMAGNSDDVGILFPRDPGGGPGDAAWIRYYPRAGENTTLEIGTSNDADDHIAVMPSGNFGIGTTAPTHKLHVFAGEAVGLFESTGSQAYLRLATAEGMGNRVEITNRPGGRLSLWTAGGGDAFNITRSGSVGVNITTPQMPLHVNCWTRIGGTGSDYLQFEAGGGNAERSTFRFDTTYLSMSHPSVGDFVIFNGVKRVKLPPPFKLTLNLDGLVEFRQSVQVSKNLTVSGDLFVSGTLTAAKKNGFVVDQFVNTLGEALETGDVVVVGERQEALYYTEQSGIPVPEVDLTRSAYDGRVCGIVVEAYAPGQPGALGAAEGEESADEPVVESVADLLGPDRSSVQPGQIGLMATHGAFAHCKVDADIAPIRPGDLLTTSPTPGHAQKVLDRGQAIGAILGKALGGLEQGKGKIPAMILLQ